MITTQKKPKMFMFYLETAVSTLVTSQWQQ